jgi:uncharacterized SAM-binding protein YcdF (DUF218 family)
MPSLPSTFQLLPKFIVAAIAFLLSLILLEILFFLWVASRPSDSGHYDAIVVFAGSDDRIKQADELARQGVAPALIISPASRRMIKKFEWAYGKPGKARYILETRADTTFTNALYSSRLIREHHLKSILLVTSDYHMPRAYFLMELTTLTTRCHIGMSKVNTNLANSATWRGRVIRLELAYNEMVQVWGSLIEGGLYWLGGTQERVETRTSGISRWLREYFLFEVGREQFKVGGKK